MNRKETLFICLSDNGKDLFLLPKAEVEKAIKSMEESASSELSYSVLGSIKSTSPGIPFLLTYKIKNSNDTLYDVVYADDSFEAHLALYSKPRLKDKEVKITNTLDLRKLINEYYE